jgi:hypothetical protein
VRDGTWLSRFDGRTVTDPGESDIDHLVPLANAAVPATSNRAKGDQDPSQWRPPDRSYWCRYAHDWVVVKHYWELSVTPAEKDAVAGMLDTCEWRGAQWQIRQTAAPARSPQVRVG